MLKPYHNEKPEKWDIIDIVTGEITVLWGHIDNLAEDLSDCKAYCDLHNTFREDE